MADRLTRIILSFLAVLAVYWLYALLVVPRIDPLSDPLVGSNDSLSMIQPVGKPTDRFRDILAPIFPADSWELNQAMVLKNDQFILLINDYETLRQGVQIELKPCTVVLNPNAITSQEPGDQCLILESPEGAVLEFDRPFGLTTGGLGRLVGGRLNGKVTIRSLVPKSHARQVPYDQLEVVTSNVQMNAEEIWTPDLVRFRYGGNFGSGRDLRISLTELENAAIRRLPNEPGDAPIHLRTLELVHLDELTVTTATQSTLASSSPTTPTTLRVHCEGALTFDFVGGAVTLEDQVSIQRQVGPMGLPNSNVVSHRSRSSNAGGDFLTCDTLAMRFSPQRNANDRDSANEATDKDAQARARWQMPQFELAQISAFGGPAVVDAPTYGVRAQAEKIELQLSHNRLRLQDTKEAILQYRTHIFRAPQMEYFVDPQGGPGRAEVVGGGQYVGTLENDIVQLFWNDRLDFGPRDGNYLLDVSGQAHIQWGKRNVGGSAVSGSPLRSNAPLENQLTAGSLRLWLRPQLLADRSRLQPVTYQESAAGFQLNPPETRGASSSRVPLKSDTENALPIARPAEAFGERWTPDRLVARKSVRLRTPQLAGDVEFAEIEMQASDAPSRFVASAEPPALRGPILDSPFPTQTPNNHSTERYQLAGHEVRVVMQSDGPDTTPHFKSVLIQGGVRLLQTSTNADVGGLEVQGTKVELEQTKSGAVGSIVGQPAIVKSRGVEVSGSNIQVDQGQNRVWIDDAGSAFIPLPQSVAARFSRKTATMQVSWQGGMNFDGKSVTCDDHVEIRGPAQRATARSLRLTLAEPIRFDAMGREASDVRRRFPGQPEQVLAQVALTGDVWLENRSFDDRGQASIDEFRVVTLNYDQSTGQLVGEGPGTMSSKRFTNNTAISPAKPSIQLTHTLIEFQKQLHGSLKKREVSVYDRVRAIHGPIVNWKQELRFDAPSQSPETVTMLATRLTVAQMPGDRGQPTLEFSASGKTEIRGHTFVANSEHVRYAQAKDLLVMEGEGRGVAVLSHQSRVGAPRESVAARKIEYRIRQRMLNVRDVMLGDVTAHSSRPMIGHNALPLPTRSSPNPSSPPGYARPPLQQPQRQTPPNVNRPFPPPPNRGLSNPAIGNSNMLNSTNQPASRQEVPPNGVYGRYPQPSLPPNAFTPSRGVHVPTQP